MMKKTMKSVLSCAVFLTVLVLLIAGASRILEYKGGREKIAPFIERADQIDVLFFGDSHAFGAIYPMELWEDYGIAAYNMANYNLTIPTSYWVMRQALNYCSPKVVVLDVDQIWEHEKLCASSGDVHTGLDGFPLSPLKVEAVFDLMDNPQLMDSNGKYYTDMRLEFLFPFIRYHSRWSDLTIQDLYPDYNKELGGERYIDIVEPDEYEITASTTDEQGYGFVYLRRFIEYCQSQGIEVMLTNYPYPCRNYNEEQLYTNTVEYTAEEYGVEYIDFVYLDQIVDYSTDCYDPASHLNPSGAWKVTDFIGQRLAEDYGLADHRGEAAYATWHDDYAAYRESKLKSIREAADPYTFLMLLADPSFSSILMLPEDSAAYMDDRAMQLLQNAGRRHLMMEDTYDAVWSDSLMPLELLLEPETDRYMAVLDKHDAAIAETWGSGAVDTSFGKVTLDESTGDAVIEGGFGSVKISAQPDKDVHAVILDKETGEVLYERAIQL